MGPDLKLPAGVTLGPLSRQVFEILSRYTAFPWPVMVGQAKRLGLDPAQITAGGLRQLIPFLSSGVARFTSPQKGESARHDLEMLL